MSGVSLGDYFSIVANESEFGKYGKSCLLHWLKWRSQGQALSKRATGRIAGNNVSCYTAQAGGNRCLKEGGEISSWR
jgi:hypothetical protein